MNQTWKTGIYQYKVEHNALWLLAFQHNTALGPFNSQNVKYHLQPGKFSILSRISNSHYVKRFNESYEFLLEYPNEFQGEYNRWLQNKDPDLEQDEDNTHIKADGFTPIALSWSYGFGGLMKSVWPASYLDGQTGSKHWFYAIGDLSDQYYPNTPGPFTEQNGQINGHNVSCVKLWIRISKPNDICQTKPLNFPKIYYQNLFYFLFIIS